MSRSFRFTLHIHTLSPNPPTQPTNHHLQAAKSVGITTLPPSLTPALSSDSSFLRALHHVLVNVHVVSGVLTCPETGKEFAISDGIANFMLEEEECANVKI